MQENNKNIINIAIAGSLETDTGQRTSTLVEQLEALNNTNIKVVYNKDIEDAELILEKANLQGKYKYIDNKKGLKNSGHKNIITDNLEVFLDIENIDVVMVTEVDIGIAVDTICKSLKKKINVINMNAVSEVTLGRYFKDLAYSNNVIYSVGAGDEPAATLDLIGFCEKLGLDIICAGKGKNNPLNIYCNPDDFIEKGREIGVSPRSIASFVDGTKTMLEMAILSNSTGFPIDKPGMHGPRVNVSGLVRTFNLEKDGGILNRVPVIDYAIGDVAPGVFVVFTSRQKSIINELNYLKMGDGPNFLLYKPYHLGNIEAPLSIYDVVLEKRPTLTVKDNFITQVAARAKKDLKAGHIIDIAGGYDFSGFAVDYKEMVNKNHVPIGLVEKNKLKRNIEKDKIISFEDIECNTDSIIFDLWNLQSKN